MHSHLNEETIASRTTDLHQFSKLWGEVTIIGIGQTKTNSDETKRTKTVIPALGDPSPTFTETVCNFAPCRPHLQD